VDSLEGEGAVPGEAQKIILEVGTAFLEEFATAW